MSTWRIEVTDGDRGDQVEVQRNGSWFTDADDLDDAIGILNAQRAKSVEINDHGHITTRSL